MKALKDLMNRLAAEGRDITELERMIGDLEEARTCTDVDYYEGQIYGVLTGLCIMGYTGHGSRKAPAPTFLQEEEP